MFTVDAALVNDFRTTLVEVGGRGLLNTVGVMSQIILFINYMFAFRDAVAISEKSFFK